MSIFDNLNSEDFWVSIKEPAEQLFSDLIYQGTLWELVEQGRIICKTIMLSGYCFYSLNNDMETVGKMAILNWTTIEPFSESCESHTRFGFRLKRRSIFKDFYTENSEELDKWLDCLSKICIKNDIEDDYEFVKEIGKGGFADVRLAKEIESDEMFAIKGICKAKVMEFGKNFDPIVDEIQIMRSLNHPNIVKLHRVYESETHVYLVLDYLEGGNLLRRLKSKGFYSEELARKITLKLLEVLEYLHSKNIVHRDIKLENILLVSKSSDIEIKIIDFGLACESNGSLTMRCGSPGYLAPEILKLQPYNEKVDIYSTGIVLYTLLSGIHPFEGYSGDKKLSQNRNGRLFFDEHCWGHVSKAAINVINLLANPDPISRLNASEAQKIKWFQVLGSGVRVNVLQRTPPEIRSPLTRGKSLEKYKAQKIKASRRLFMSRESIEEDAKTAIVEVGENKSPERKRREVSSRTEVLPKSPSKGSKNRKKHLKILEELELADDVCKEKRRCKK
ncbi:unnamed protein product [Blepharisma stoltei]|uniref:Protein kinase domain-containing protein n=1 Tax=Blepharisma stoltei TaxID=1481888 RepID=A0AAU9IYR3_9CILI|nr:unnamed protein product [Blepharisma stoltei]